MHVDTAAVRHSDHSHGRVLRPVNLVLWVYRGEHNVELLSGWRTHDLIKWLAASGVGFPLHSCLEGPTRLKMPPHFVGPENEVCIHGCGFFTSASQGERACRGTCWNR